MPFRQTFLALACSLSLALVAAACAGEDNLPIGVFMDTVEGVINVANRGPGRWSVNGDTPWSVGPERLRVGAVDGPPEAQFGSISGLSVGPDGVLWVADGQAQEIRAFASDGAFVRTVGGTGEGPGEFTTLDGVRVGPDGRIYGRDPQLNRATVFESDGTLVTTFTMARPFTQLGAGDGWWVAEDGTVRDRMALPARVGDSRPAVVTFGTDGSVLDTLIGRPYRPAQISVKRNGMPVVTMPMPWAAQTVLTATPSGTVLAGHGDTYRIAEIGPGGDTLRVVTRGVEPEPVPSGQEHLVDSLSRLALEYGRSGDDVEADDLPERQPFFSRVHVDALGFWWVGRGDTRNFGGVYDVFDPEGRYLGQVEVPDLIVREIGADYVAGTRNGDMEQSMAVVMELHRSRPPG